MQQAVQPPPLVRRLCPDRGGGLGRGGRGGVLGGGPAGPGPEDQALGERVGAEPVGAVDADAGGLAGGVQAGNRGRAVDVGVHPAHHVVHDRPDRDQLPHRIDPLVLQAELPDEGELGRYDLLAEMAQVQVDDRTVRAVDRLALLDLLDERLG